MPLVLHISGTIHHMIFIYDTHMPNDISSSFFHSFKILIFMVVQGRVGKRAKKQPKITKHFVHHAIYLKNHTSHHMIVIYGTICKRIISPGAFFIFQEFYSSGLFVQKKGKNSVCHTPYSRKHTSYDCGFWYTFVK